MFNQKIQNPKTHLFFLYFLFFLIFFTLFLFPLFYPSFSFPPFLFSRVPCASLLSSSFFSFSPPPPSSSPPAASLFSPAWPRSLPLPPLLRVVLPRCLSHLAAASSASISPFCRHAYNWPPLPRPAPLRHLLLRAAP